MVELSRGLLQNIKEKNVHVKTGDSMSCTSLSICTSSGTVISKSALDDGQE